MAICGLKNCDYTPPADYNPQYGVYSSSGSYADRAALGSDQKNTIWQNCMTLAAKDVFYVATDGTLQGYSWFNIFGRIFLYIANRFSNGKIDVDAVRKIEDTFRFILGIRQRIGHLNCTSFDSVKSGKYFCPYEYLAKKVITQYPKEAYPDLYVLAHRILHERSLSISFTINDHLGRTAEVTYKNNKSNARGTPFETTTVWDY